MVEETVARLRGEVVDALKRRFVGRDERLFRSRADLENTPPIGALAPGESQHRNERRDSMFHSLAPKRPQNTLATSMNRMITGVRTTIMMTGKMNIPNGKVSLTGRA